MKCKICGQEIKYNKGLGNPEDGWICYECLNPVKVIVGETKMKDRIEQTYKAIDEIISASGNSRPQKFGGGFWNAEEEFRLYKKQVGNRYTLLQWKIITTYFIKQMEKHPKGHKQK